MTERVKRQYQSEVRAAAAAETQERIRRAATELFVARGYAGTTLKDVAERAGVGERTLYDAFGSKLRLLAHTINILTMGDEERVRMADRPVVKAARETDDPHRALIGLIDFNCALMERAADLLIVGEEASRTDPVIAESVRRGTEAAFEAFIALTRRLDERGQLRPGLDAETAAETLFTMSSPGVFHHLRRRRRWGRRHYRDWVVDSAARLLLPHDGQTSAEENASR